MISYDILLQAVIAGLANGALYAFVGLGIGFIYRSTGIINLAQGEMTMLGAMLTAVLSAAGWPVLLAMVAAALICGVVSGLFYMLVIWPAAKATMSQLVILTLGLSVLLRGVVTAFWGTDPLRVPPLSGSSPVRLGEVSVLPQQLWLVAALACLAGCCMLFFKRTKWGLALRAGAANVIGSMCVGIDHKRLAFMAFMLAGVLGGAGGAVWSPIAFAQVDIGMGIVLKGFAAAVLGGLATPAGPIVGAAILGLFESLTAGYVSSAYRDAIVFALLLLVLVFRPQGLMGKRSRGIQLGSHAEALGVKSVAQTHTAHLTQFGMLAVLLASLGATLQGAWLTVGVLALVLTLVVLGLVVLTGYTGQLALGQGVFMMLGAYATAFLTQEHGWPALGAMAFGAVLAVAVAMICGYFILRLQGFYMSVASLALLMIALTLARELTHITGGPSGRFGVEPFSLFGWSADTELSMFYLLAAVCLLAWLGTLSLLRSSFGRSLLALRSSEAAARACGVPVTTLKVRAFALSAFLASVAGSFYVHFMSLATPQPFGLESTIMQLTALVVGGALSLTGAFFGAAFVVALPLFITGLFGTNVTEVLAGVQLAVFGLLLMVIIVVRSRRSQWGHRREKAADAGGQPSRRQGREPAGKMYKGGKGETEAVL